MYENLTIEEKNKMMIIFFDEFVQNPDAYVDKICKKLNTKRSDLFRKFLNKSNLPRKVTNPITSIENFQFKYSTKLRPVYMKLILELNDKYIDFYNLIRFKK